MEWLFFTRKQAKTTGWAGWKWHQMKINMPIHYQLAPVPTEVLIVPFSWMLPGEMGHTQHPSYMAVQQRGKRKISLYFKPRQIERKYFCASQVAIKTIQQQEKKRTAECVADGLPWDMCRQICPWQCPAALAQVALRDSVTRVNHCISKRRCNWKGCNWKLAGTGPMKSCVNFKCCSMYNGQHWAWTSDLCQGGLPSRGSYCLDAYQGLLSVLSFPFKLSSSYCTNVWLQTRV